MTATIGFTGGAGSTASININGSPVLTLDASGNLDGVASINGGALGGFRNKIINGSMLIAQRSTSAALVSGAYCALDRWMTYSAVNTGVFSQVASGLDGFRYAAKLQRNAGQTSTSGMQLMYAMETSDSIPMQGKSVTLSFYAKAGANFSGANVSCRVYTGTGTDQATINIGSWTGVSTIANQNNSITTSWTRFQVTGTVAASATQIGVVFAYNPTGTAGADDSFSITGVQLEEGSVATPFESRAIGQELALCQRYYYRVQSTGGTYRLTDTGYAVSTTQAYALNHFPVSMRTEPTALEQSGTASHYVCERFGNAANVTCSSVPTFVGASKDTAITQLTVASGLVNSGAGMVYANSTASAYLGWSAEL